jgi:hypothetical protein
MTKKYPSFITLVLALAGLLGFSSLGIALTLDATGVAHMPWEPLSKHCRTSAVALPGLPAGVVSVQRDINGSFVATVTAGTTAKNYLLNPSNLSAGWNLVEAFTPALPDTTKSTYDFPFGFGLNSPGSMNLSYDPAAVTPIYSGNSAKQFLFHNSYLFLFVSSTQSTVAQYGISPWPMPNVSSFVGITTDDVRMPSFQIFEVLNNSSLFIVRCLETKTNQYYAMIILPQSESPWMEMTDLIAPGKTIVSMTGSNDGSPANADSESFLAVADDGSTYYCPPTKESASETATPTPTN